jgi:hypothetical protein
MRYPFICLSFDLKIIFMFFLNKSDCFERCSVLFFFRSEERSLTQFKSKAYSRFELGFILRIEFDFVC